MTKEGWSGGAVSPRTLNASFVRSRRSHPATVPSLAVTNATLLSRAEPGAKLETPFCVVRSVPSGSSVRVNARTESSEPANR